MRRARSGITAVWGRGTWAFSGATSSGGLFVLRIRVEGFSLPPTVSPFSQDNAWAYVGQVGTGVSGPTEASISKFPQFPQ
jgi:hypothetical protein